MDNIAPAPNEEVFTVDEAASILRISRMSAYRAAHAGEIPSIKVGRRILIPKAGLDALLGKDVRGGYRDHHAWAARGSQHD